MKKIYPYILGIIGLIIIGVGVSKSYAENVVYTNLTNGYILYVKDISNTNNGTAVNSNMAYFSVYSPDGLYIIYSNFSDGTKLYRKNANDTSNGTAITSVSGQYPAYSPDGLYIIYKNGADSNKLYRKNANDTSNGSAINSIGITDAQYSLDGLYIYYSTNSGIYKKNANDTSDGTRITTPILVGNLTISKNGLYIAYNEGTGNLYLKNSGDSSNGTLLLTRSSDTTPEFSQDGNFLIYSNSSDGGKLYKKIYNDTSSGTAITSDNGKYPSVIRSNSSGNIPYPGQTFSLSGLTCKTTNYTNFVSTPYVIGGSGTYSDNSSGSIIPDSFKMQWLNFDNSYQDRFSVYPSAGMYLDTATFTGGLNANKVTTIYSDLDSISAGLPTTMSVALTRTGASALINYVKIKTTNQGFSPINSLYSNIVAEAVFTALDNTQYTYPITYSGGYATAISNYPSKFLKIKFTTGTVTFNGFEVGYSNSGTTSKTSCSNQSFDCKYVLQPTGSFVCNSSLNVSGIPMGECEIVTNICQPKANIVPFYDGVVVPGGAIQAAINSSGATVGLSYEEEDIFACSESGLSVLICPFIVLKKIWAKFTFIIKKLANLIYGISSLGSPGGTGNIFSFFYETAYAGGIKLDTPFDIAGSGSSSTSYTGADLGNLNKSILKASDNVYAMNSDGIKGIYAFSMWTLILIGVVVVIVIFLIAFK